MYYSVIPCFEHMIIIKYFVFLFNLILLTFDIIICVFSNKKNESNYWIGKDSLKCWRRMYLEIFEYFVNNHDVAPKTKLPLNPDIPSQVYNASSNFADDNQFLKSDANRSSKQMGGITLDSLTNCVKLAGLFVNNSALIYDVLRYGDFSPFHTSLLELQTVLKDMMNIFTSVIAKKINEELAIEERRSKMRLEGIKIKSEFSFNTDDESKIDKEDDVDENSQEEKDKHDDSDSLDNNKNDMECMSWVFNEDITCPHGKYIFEVLTYYQLAFVLITYSIRLFDGFVGNVVISKEALNMIFIL